MAFITLRIKGEEGYSRHPLDKDRVLVGRASACDLPIRHASISREHCAFVRDGELWAVEDLGSANGTMVGDAKVSGKALLSEKDVIKIGQARLTFHSGDLAAAEEDRSVPSRQAGANDPAAAAPCEACGRWVSVAHRSPGDRMTCPHCAASLTVPTLIPAP